MFKSALSLGLAAALCMAVSAQNTSTKSSGKVSGKDSTTVSKGDKSIGLNGATDISATLQNSLNVERAQVGDEVILKTKKAVKENGQVIIEKGSLLVGRVTEVSERAKGMAASKIGVVFDTLRQNGENIAINAMITSITQAAVNTRVADDDVFASGSGSGSVRSTTQTSSSSSSGGGGLLGGVTNTVGGVVNTTASTVGSVAGTATQTVTPVVDTVGNTVGGTTRTLGSNIRGLQISQSANASASGGSTLTLNGGNLKLDKGTTFNLNITEAGSISSTGSKRQKN